MPQNFQVLRQKLSPEARARVDKKKAAALRSMPLAEIRKAQQLTQKDLAEKLHIEQPAISKIESRSDLCVSTLRQYIEGMGGVLEVRADFPGGSFNINIGWK